MSKGLNPATRPAAATGEEDSGVAADSAAGGSAEVVDSAAEVSVAEDSAEEVAAVEDSAAED